MGHEGAYGLPLVGSPEHSPCSPLCPPSCLGKDLRLRHQGRLGAGAQSDWGGGDWIERQCFKAACGPLKPATRWSLKLEPEAWQG